MNTTTSRFIREVELKFHAFLIAALGSGHLTAWAPEPVCKWWRIEKPRITFFQTVKHKLNKREKIAQHIYERWVVRNAALLRSHASINPFSIIPTQYFETDCSMCLALNSPVKNHHHISLTYIREAPCSNLGWVIIYPNSSCSLFSSASSGDCPDNIL
jgi:hypothetical protein